MIKKYWHFGLFTIIILLFFSPILTGKYFYYNGDISGSDLLNFNYPVKQMMQSGYQSGTVPIWQDEVGAGFPMMFEGQMGFFYPINYLVYRFVPMPLAFNLSIVLHFIIAGLGMLIYLRFLGVRRNFSLFGALVFSLSGFFLAHTKHINLIAAAAWLPWIFYFFEKYWQNKKIRWAVYSGILLAIQILAGHTQISYISGFSLFCFYLFRILFSVKYKDYQSKIFWIDLILKLKNFVFYFLAVLIIIFSLSAIQILPTWQLVQQSYRIDNTYLNSVQFSFTWSDFLGFVNPFAFGNPADGSYGLHFKETRIFWENIGYIGLLPLFFFFLFILFFKKIKKLFKTDKIWPLILLIILSILLVLGSHSIFYAFAYIFIPGMQYFRVPSRFLLITVFCITILAVLGIEYFWQRFKLHIRNSKLRKRIAAVLIGFVIILSVLDFVYFNFKYQTLLKTSDWLQKPISVTQIKADNDYKNDRIFDFAAGLTRISAYQQNQGWQNPRWLVGYRNSLQANSNYTYKLNSLNLYSGLNLARPLTIQSRFFMSAALRQNWSGMFPVKRAVVFNKAFNNYLSISNTKYILSYFDLNLPGLELWQSIPVVDNFLPLNIYKNENVLPKAWLVGKQEVYASGDEVFTQGLVREDFDSSQTVLLEKQPEQLLDSEVLGSVEINYWHNGKIVLKVNTDKPAWLVVSNSYYPDWYAWINSEKTELYQANYLYEAVQVPAGESIVELKFVPIWYYLGLVLSSLSMLVLAILGILQFKKYLWIRWKLNN